MHQRLHLWCDWQRSGSMGLQGSRGWAVGTRVGARGGEGEWEGQTSPLPEGISPPHPLYSFASQPQPMSSVSRKTPELYFIDSNGPGPAELLASWNGHLLSGPAPSFTSVLGPPEDGESGEAPGTPGAAGPCFEWSQLTWLAVTSPSAHLGGPHLRCRHLGERVAPRGFLVSQHSPLFLWEDN